MQIIMFLISLTPRVFFSVTLTDNVCGVSYIDINTRHYLVWDGSHIGQDTLVNLLDYSIIEKEDSGSCKVGFQPLYTSFHVCVTVKEFHIEDCNATVNYYHSGDSEIKAVRILFSVQILLICSRLLAVLNDVRLRSYLSSMYFLLVHNFNLFFSFERRMDIFGLELPNVCLTCLTEGSTSF